MWTWSNTYLLQMIQNDSAEIPESTFPKIQEKEDVTGIRDMGPCESWLVLGVGTQVGCWRRVCGGSRIWVPGFIEVQGGSKCDYQERTLTMLICLWFVIGSLVSDGSLAPTLSLYTAEGHAQHITDRYSGSYNGRHGEIGKDWCGKHLTPHPMNPWYVFCLVSATSVPNNIGDW